MSKVFSKRLSSHLTEMIRYLRLVFNDYFVLALLFLIGGLGYYYSIGLRKLSIGIWWAPIVTAIVMIVTLQLGRLATLLEDPDYVFLLPKESEMVQYFRSSFRYSCILGLSVQVLIWFILIPFVQRTSHLDTSEIFFMLITMIVLKLAWLELDLARKYRLKYEIFANRLIFRFIIPAIIVILGVYLNYLVAMIFSVIYFIIIKLLIGNLSGLVVNWRLAISDENSRMHSVYSFFNLFTDVPSLQGTVKRRKYLDVILQRTKLIPENTYLYLYSHGILRDNEMSGLFVRLTVLGVLFLIFIKGLVMPVFLAALFIYLIGFQLLPFYFHFSDNVFIHIYPITGKFQMKNFQRIILWFLTITGILFAITIIFVNYNNPATIAAIIIVETAEIWLFTFVYLPRRISKGIMNR